MNTQMTQNEIQRQAEQLRKLVNTGEATPEQAERLAELERTLRRMNVVRFGRA